MNTKIYRESEGNFSEFFDEIKYWSNALGELHCHGKHDITLNELPNELLHAYTDLFFEGNIGSLRYLVETSKGYGIALINEYDNFTAENSGLSMDVLFETVICDANTISKDPLFQNAEIFVGEFTGCNDCHDLIVVFPADILAEDFYKAAGRLDELAYQTCFKKEKTPLDKQIQNAQVRTGVSNRSEVLEYDSALAQRCTELDGVDVLSPQNVSNLLGKPVKNGDTLYHPEFIDRNSGR